VEVSLVRLDPMATDHHDEAARMRALGPVVRAIRPGEVSVWVATEHALFESAEAGGATRLAFSVGGGTSVPDHPRPRTSSR
jgi:hypothetical protein